MVAICQERPILSFSVIDGTFAKLIGGSGLVKIIAPLPGREGTEIPTIFMPDTVAKILDPHGKLNGEVTSEEIGIAQVRLDTTIEVLPLQLRGSSVNVTLSLWRTLILYPVICEPPSPGIVHDIVTKELLIAVIGARG
jgi:hypothetical protein